MWSQTEDAKCAALGTLQLVVPDQCGYSAPRYIPDAIFEYIPGVNFNNTYGTGETINGPLWYTKLVFDGLTVLEKQISAAATYASVGDDSECNVSGLLGLGHPRSAVCC